MVIIYLLIKVLVKVDLQLISILFKAGINYISALFICLIKFNYNNIVDH